MNRTSLRKGRGPDAGPVADAALAALGLRPGDRVRFRRR